MVIQRDYLSDITRVGLGPAVDDRSYVRIRTEEGDVHAAFIRMNSTVFYVYEWSDGPIRDRLFASVTRPESYDAFVRSRFLTYRSLIRGDFARQV